MIILYEQFCCGSPLDSDDLVEKILHYFNKGLKYLVPADLFSYKVINKHDDGWKTLQKDGKEKDKSHYVFREKLLQQLTHVLSEPVSVKGGLNCETFLYCT